VSATLDKIIAEVRALPPDEQLQLLAVLEQETNGSERARRPRPQHPGQVCAPADGQRRVHRTEAARAQA
jgi:hypothetical protein